MRRVLLGSIARLVPFARPERDGLATFDEDLGVQPLPRGRWRNGDHVVVQVVHSSARHVPVELPSGRLATLSEGDLVLGALGRRAATLEAVGSWEAVGDDLQAHLLTPAGLIGRATSVSDLIPPLVEVAYVGHAWRDGQALRMADLVPPLPPATLRIPVVLVMGSSMSAGKTQTGRALVRALVRQGHRVFGVKVTGAARYRDVLTYRDAGADEVLDFVDAGLPSTVVPAEEYRRALRLLLARVAASTATVAVVEAGASPLEPYNGAVAVEELAVHLACTVLCASDPYAVVGILGAFGLRPALVAGPVANTEAGVALVHRLSGLEALDARSVGALPRLEALLAGTVGPPPPP